MNKLKITALAAGIAQILIYDDIGKNYWYEDQNVDAKSIVAQLDAITENTIEVRIKSNGGDLEEALAIRNAFDRKDAEITFYLDGVVASAATVIPMIKRHKVVMASNALFMVHAPSTWTDGNANDLRNTANALDKYSEAWAENIIEKTGKPKDDIIALLTDGLDHYFTAQEALDFGFVDEIANSVPIMASALPKNKTLPTAWLEANKLTVSATLSNPNQSQPTGHNPMATTTENENPEKTPPPENTDVILAKAKKEAEHQRQTTITAIFAHVPKERADIHAMMPAMLINAAMTEEKARETILAELGKNAAPVARGHHIVNGTDGRDLFISDATDAILAKAGVIKANAKNSMRGWRLERIAEECLIQASLATNMDRMGIVSAAFTQSTSDFPVLLENALNKSLLSAYQTAPDTWQRFCAVGTVSDFRPHNRYRSGSFGNLDALNELSEFKNKSIPDGEKASITIGTKGNIINISRQAIINDDMGAFIGLAVNLARAAKRTVEADVFTLLTSNPTLGDSVALFHSTHGNIGTAANVTVASLDEARQLMAAQKDISGNDYLSLLPSVLLCGMANGGNARVVNGSQYDPDTANKIQRPNIAFGTLTDIIDTPRLAGNVWYVLADPAIAPTIEVAFLDGQTEPYLEMQNGWNVDGAAYKVRLDYGVAAIDYRGAVKNAGA